ncbi:XAC2610-related protein [Pedobacter sp. N23S346]|uniref:XAC2610-related protein n=1 Tax=Pedobacter sp. N23S346 TaxID=3402750 RepID=UPI003AC28362
MKNLLIICAALFISFNATAQFKFLSNNTSNEYNAKLFVGDCNNGHCEGKSTIMLYDKISGEEIQTFSSIDLDFSLTDKQDARIGWIDLGKYQSPLIFGDFNFDGLEDLAIRNGNNGAYASPSYDVYLSSKSRKFVLDKNFTKLASENLGMFDIDRKKKQISVEEKSGCCYHKTTSYTIDAKKGLTEVASVIEDSSIGDDVTVITQKLIGGKMQKTIQKFKTKDYYAEQ